MTPEQKAAFINAQVACMLATLEGMKAANRVRESEGLALAYDDKAFFELQEEYGLGYNTVIDFFRD